MILKKEVFYLQKNRCKMDEYLRKSRQLLTQKGSLLCHAAIIARELNVPCITKINNLDFEKLRKSAT